MAALFFISSKIKAKEPFYGFVVGENQAMNEKMTTI